MRQLLFLGSLIFGLIIFGLISLNGILIALALPLLFYLGAAVFFGPEKPDLLMTRTLSRDSTTRAQPVEVHVALTNQGHQIEEILVEDILPKGLAAVEGDTKILTSLAPGEIFQFDYKVQGKRGIYDFGPMAVTVSDPLGITYKKSVISAEQRLLIFPDYQKLRPLSIHPPRTRDYPGPIRSRQGGAGVDFYGVREYQMGDPIRWINWKVSARHSGTLFTNEFEKERIADVGIIVDARQQSDIQRADDTLFDYSVYAAASMADAFLTAGNRVGLLVYGRGMERTFPGYGKVQRERILQSLAYARTGVNFALESLELLPTRFFPSRSQIVMISPLNPDDYGVLVRLRASGYDLILVSPDPISYEMAKYKPGNLVDTARRLATIERALLIRRMQRVGIQVVNWDVNTSLDKALTTVLAQQVRTHHVMGVVR